MCYLRTFAKTIKKKNLKINLNVIKTMLNFKTKLQKKVLGPNKNNTGRQLLTNY